MRAPPHKTMRTLSFTSPLLSLAVLLLQAPALGQAPEQAPKKEAEAAESREAPSKDGAAPEEGEGEPSDDASSDEAEADAAAAEAEANAPGADADADADAAAAEAEAAAAEADAAGQSGEADAKRPAPKGKGVIWGRVADSKTDEAALEAQVKVEGRKAETLTDYDGFYRLELPPGSYTVRVFYEMHEPLRLQNVIVVEGEVRRLDAVLEPQEGMLEEVVVEEEAEKATLEGQLLARQQSATVQDGVGRAEIAKTTDSNAAEAAQRVVGATIVGGQFVYVRGLGERYTNSLLHGAPLPSTDPNRAAVPLDLFPTQVIDSINIAKTFTPDMPADFAGGSVQIETRSIPNKFIFAANLKGAFNDQTTFRERLDYRGGSTDWLGFDDGTRAMPGSVPKDYPLLGFQEKPDGSRVTPEEITQAGHDMNTYMSTTRSTSPPNHGLSLVAGNGYAIDKAKGSKWGWLASVNYDRSYQRITDGIERVFTTDHTENGSFKKFTDYEYERGQSEAKWGAYGSLLLDVDRHNRFRLTGLHSQSGLSAASSYDGYTDDQDTIRLNNTRLQFVQKGMTFGQLVGEHDFPALGNSTFDYNIFTALARRYEPDTRDTVYSAAAGQPFAYRNSPDSGRHFWSDQAERTVGAGVNYTQPLGVNDARFKLGGLGSMKKREFEARRFYYKVNPRAQALECEGSSDSFPANCPDAHFIDENIGVFPGQALELADGTKPGDKYESELNVYAGYMMVDARVAEGTRLIFGPRVEVTDQSVTPLTIVGQEPEAEAAQINDVSLLPGAAVVFDVTESSKIRVSASRTLARPQVRELAPFAFSDYFGGMQVVGNTQLELTKILNGDVRYEYFPTLREVLAASFFVKDFKDPIEPILISDSGGPTLTYINASGATVYGIELEARKNLGFLSPTLLPFALVGNVTLAHSQIDLGAEASENLLTNTTRPLVNQAPFVLNLALDYEGPAGLSARVLYNVTAARLVQVGTRGLPDAYMQPRHSLDFTVGKKIAEHWDVKITAENLVNDDFLVTQGEDEAADGSNIQSQYRTGRIFGIAAGYNL